MRLQQLLNIKYPIIQAPMAGADSSAFVAAASNAGILGSLGAQYRTPDEIEKAIAEIKSLTDKPFAINLFALPELTPPGAAEIEEALSHLTKYYEHFNIEAPSVETVQKQLDADDQLEAVLDAGAPIFSFTLGMLRKEWIDKFKQHGVKVIGTATNVIEAGVLWTHGVDAIAAQGSEAGGHRGTFIGHHEDSMIGTIALIPQIVDMVKIPVIAAGGIMDGRGIAAALALGADGVQMGTAFLTANESPTHAKYKSAVRQGNDTTITKAFSGGAARGVKNLYIEENNDKPLLPFPYHNNLTRDFRKAANKTGQIEYTNLWSGQAGRLARQKSIQALVNELIQETRDVLRSIESISLE